MTAIGLDVGGSRLRGGRVEGGDGRIVARVACELGADKRPERVAALIAHAVEELGGGARDVALGIGFAAILRGRDGRVAVSPNHGWRDVAFGQILAAQLGSGRPFVMENDLTAITWGEFRFGAGRGAESVVAVFVGTGVGGGAVLLGRPFRGATNSSMEVGHVVMDPAGPVCGCGQRGCLEAYVGGRYVGERPDWAALGAILGRALGGLVTVMNPDRLIMGGSVWLGQPRLRAEAVETLRRVGSPPAVEAVAVVDSMLGDDAGILGAADLATAS